MKKEIKLEKQNPKIQNFNPLIFGAPKLCIFGYPLLTCTRILNLGPLGPRVSELDGIRLKKNCPLGAQF